MSVFVEIKGNLLGYSENINARVNVWMTMFDMLNVCGDVKRGDPALLEECEACKKRRGI